MPEPRRRSRKVVRHPSSPPDRRLFGACLLQKRFDLGYTRAAVITRLGRRRSHGWLARYESGYFLRLMPQEEFRDLCRVLSLNPVELLLACGLITRREVDVFLAESEDREVGRARLKVGARP